MRTPFEIFLGACLGGGLRLLIDAAIPTEAWAWDLVVVNILGSALLGALIGWWEGRHAPRWVLALGTGGLGGFTTFSSLAAPHPQGTVSTAVVLVSTMIACMIAAGLGWWAAETIRDRRAAEVEA